MEPLVLKEMSEPSQHSRAFFQAWKPRKEPQYSIRLPA